MKTRSRHRHSKTVGRYRKYSNQSWNVVSVKFRCTSSLQLNASRYRNVRMQTVKRVSKTFCLLHFKKSCFSQFLFWREKYTFFLLELYSIQISTTIQHNGILYLSQIGDDSSLPSRCLVCVFTEQLVLHRH